MFQEEGLHDLVILGLLSSRLAVSVLGLRRACQNKRRLFYAVAICNPSSPDELYKYSIFIQKVTKTIKISLMFFNYLFIYFL